MTRTSETADAPHERVLAKGLLSESAIPTLVYIMAISAFRFGPASPCSVSLGRCLDPSCLCSVLCLRARVGLQRRAARSGFYKPTVGDRHVTGAVVRSHGPSLCRTRCEGHWRHARPRLCGGCAAHCYRLTWIEIRGHSRRVSLCDRTTAPVLRPLRHGDMSPSRCADWRLSHAYREETAVLLVLIGLAPTVRPETAVLLPYSLIGIGLIWLTDAKLATKAVACVLPSSPR